jgi:hypothetical protein
LEEDIRKEKSEIVRTVLAEDSDFTEPPTSLYMQCEEHEKEDKAQRKRRKMINARNREILDRIEELGMLTNVCEIETERRDMSDLVDMRLSRGIAKV